MKKLMLLFAFAAMLVSCGRTQGLLPNVSGKAGEVIVVLDRENWDGDLGAMVRDILGGDCPYLAQKEPLYTLVNVSPTGFGDLFKVHRNILVFTLDEQTTEEGTVYRQDVWSRPQCIIQINATDGESALRIFSEDSNRILAALEQAERDRIIANCKKYEEYPLFVKVSEMVGGSPHFPMGYKLKKATDDFIWIADEKQYTNQGIFIYKYPASENENFTVENIIAHRNRILQENVPGMFENTYMTTATYIPPTTEFLRFRGRQFAQTRGFWEVQGDFMGGPFVSHSFYGPNAEDIVVLDAWVYAPRYDKRQYFRQVESIIYSFEWADQKEEK